MPDTPDRDAIRRRLESRDIHGLSFIAHAPADIAALLAYTELLEKAVAETAKLCRDAVEEIGIREAAHGHGVTSGPNYTPTDADYEAAKKGCWFCIRVEVLDEAVRAIDAALARREGEA